MINIFSTNFIYTDKRGDLKEFRFIIGVKYCMNTMRSISEIENFVIVSNVNTDAVFYISITVKNYSDKEKVIVSILQNRMTSYDYQRSSY